jgi:hypothetical protein
VIVPAPRQALDALAGQQDIASAQVFGDRLHVWIDRGDGDAAMRSVTEAINAAGLRPSSLRPIVPSLEDVFIARLSAVDGASVS